jgi:hypothetical protein
MGQASLFTALSLLNYAVDSKSHRKSREGDAPTRDRLSKPKKYQRNCQKAPLGFDLNPKNRTIFRKNLTKPNRDYCPNASLTKSKRFIHAELARSSISSKNNLRIDELHVRRVDTFSPLAKTPWRLDGVCHFSRFVHWRKYYVESEFRAKAQRACGNPRCLYAC